jgi:hypothetical protein
LETLGCAQYGRQAASYERAADQERVNMLQPNITLRIGDTEVARIGLGTDWLTNTCLSQAKLRDTRAGGAQQ